MKNHPDLHGRVPLLRQPLEVFAGLDPDGHGLVDLLDGLVMLSLDLRSSRHNLKRNSEKNHIKASLGGVCNRRRRRRRNIAAQANSRGLTSVRLSAQKTNYNAFYEEFQTFKARS